MHNFLEYSDNYSMISGNLWNYYRDEVNDAAKEIFGNHRINNSKTATSRSFQYKTKIIRRTSADNHELDTQVVVLLKYLNTFCRSLDLRVINCEIELDLKWMINRVICEISKTTAVAANLPNPAKDTTETTGASFQIKSY